jgi:hypothetical protein
MAQTDTATQRLEARQKLAREQAEGASAKISDTVRYTALGQVGAAYALIVSNTPFAAGMMREHSRLIFVVLGFGCCALVFDFSQYLATYLHGVRLAQNPEQDIETVRGHKTAWIAFWAKCAVALAGMILLALIFIKSVYFSTHNTRTTLAEVQTATLVVASSHPPCALERSSD